MAPKVLFIYNDPSAPEALLGDVFVEQGYDVDTFMVVPAERADDPVMEVTFPDPTGYDVVVPLGSRWSVHDAALSRTWVGTELQLVREAVAAGVGVLGVCFGGQLVAQALGGSVAPSPQPEVGWYQVDSAATDFIPSGPWFEWHFDRWTLPVGAVELARTPRASQAFSLGSALALQFHPELDGPLLELWIREDRDGQLQRLELDIDEIRAQTAAERDASVDRLRVLVAGFLDRVVAAGARQS